jgi:hypothetical protein
MLKYSKSIYILFLSIAIVACTRKQDAGNVDKVKINPERNQLIKLSAIADQPRWTKFESSSNSIFGKITKLEFDQGKYFLFDQLTSNSIFLFDSTGRYINKLFRKGKAPDEFTLITGFALDTIKKNILVGDNYKTLKVFDYNLKYLKTTPLSVYYKDFEVDSHGQLIINTSKIINYKESGAFSKVSYETQCYSLWLQNGDSFDKFRPFDIKIFPNGSTYNEIDRNFHRYQGRLFYNQPLNDTLFMIADGAVKPAMAIDFGVRKSDEDLLSKPGDWVIAYNAKNPNAAYMPQNFIETKDILKFDFFYGNQLNTAIQFKKDRKWLTGELVNDIYGFKLLLNQNIGNRMVAYVSPLEILNLLKDDANSSKIWYANLKKVSEQLNLTENDNYLLLNLDLRLL